VKALFDTSVLVAAMVEAHPMHAVAWPCLKRTKDGLDSGFVAAHSVAELYAVLSTLPVRTRITPSVAQQLIKHDVLDILQVIPLSAEDYALVVEQLSERGLSGGAAYDALILQSAVKA
jgi:predicted nucleic acid-binding protein